MALTIVVLVLGLIAFLAVVLGGLLLILRRSSERKLEEARAALAQDGVMAAERMANFFGTQSGSMRQIRGNGNLFLTRGALVFFMFVPRRRIDVPLESVVWLDEPEWWSGKSVGKRLLAVAFHTTSGEEDAVAFYVRDPDYWVSRIIAAVDALGLPEPRRPKERA